MNTTRSMIREWFERGLRLEATHMLVMCDDFDYEDYPVYLRQDPTAISECCEPGDRVIVVPNVRRYSEARNTNMQRVIECYDLALPQGPQLDAMRCHNYD